MRDFLLLVYLSVSGQSRSYVLKTESLLSGLLLSYLQWPFLLAVLRSYFFLSMRPEPSTNLNCASPSKLVLGSSSLSFFHERSNLPRSFELLLTIVGNNSKERGKFALMTYVASLRKSCAHLPYLKPLASVLLY